MPNVVQQNLDKVNQLNSLSYEAFERDYVHENVPHDLLQKKGYRITFHTSQTLRKHDLDQCLAIIQTTSSEAYRNSARGWSLRSKRIEMKQNEMKYLLLFNDAVTCEISSQSICGFLSFMITMEDELNVVWCYEIHLIETVRRQGLGKALIGIMEDVTKAIGFGQMMLTVFGSNQQAIDFYQRNGWVLQEEEPPPERRRLRMNSTQKPQQETIATMLKVIT